MIDELETQALEARHERDRQRDAKAPICKGCKQKTYYDKECGGYVCSGCRDHLSENGSKFRFCAVCSWGKSNFDPADAGEQWEEEEGIQDHYVGGNDWGEMY